MATTDNQDLKKTHKHRSRKGKDRDEGVYMQSLLDDNDGELWNWSYLADSHISTHPAVFTNDSRYFFIPSSTSVNIYSTSTGNLVSILSPPSPSTQPHSHSHTITSLLINPQNAYQLITASLDGHIKIWDFLDGVLLKTIDVGIPITHMCAHESIKDHVFVAGPLSNEEDKRKSKKKYSTVLRISLRPTSATSRLPIQKSTQHLQIGKARSPSGLAISPSGSHLVCTGGSKAYVAQTSPPFLKKGFTKFVCTDIITCLAFHPFEEYFATGDERGVIRLWYCLDSSELEIETSISGTEKKAPTMMMHWHAHAVSSISFSPNGAYLLSAGEEAVLVLWQLQSGHKEFVPRVGAPILSVSVAKSVQDRTQEYLLVLADASLVVVDSASLKIVRAFSRLKIDPSTSFGATTPPSPPLAIHPTTHNLILPSSHPSSLQIYTPSSQTLLHEIEVSPSNRVSRRDSTPLEPSRITHIALSSTGEWLATIDSRESSLSHSDEFSKEIALKIWKWDGRARCTINTRIDIPHGECAVTSINFRPAGEEVLVTTGSDGQIRTWALRRVRATKENSSSSFFWTTASSFEFRSSIPSQSKFSLDGSILLAVQSPFVTLWDASKPTPTLRRALTCPQVPYIFDMAVVGKAGRYIVIARPFLIVLWDLVTCQILWQAPNKLKHPHLIARPNTDEFLAWSPLDSDPDSEHSHSHRRTKILIYKTATNDVRKMRVVPFHLIQLAPYPSQEVGVGRGGGGWSLVGITSKWAIIHIADDPKILQSSRSIAGGGVGHDLSHSEGKWNLFQGIFGSAAFIEVEDTRRVRSDDDDALVGGIDLDHNFLLDGPSHLLPPIQTLFAPFMEGLLHKRPVPSSEVKVKVIVEDGDREEDVEMNEPVERRGRGERVFEQGEVNLFVELFKEMIGKDPKQASRPQNGHRNGVSHANGTSNGVGHHKSQSQSHPPPPAPSLKRKKSKAIVQAATPSSSPMTPVGQKRKNVSP